MAMIPETKYAKSGEVYIAYQAVGDGPRDLVLIPPFVSHVEIYWEEPSLVRFLTRLASFARLIVFDKCGTGLSDRVAPHALPDLEQRMDDVHAVLDAVGAQKAALLGPPEGGPMSALFAATYPERTTALILYGTFASTIRDAAYPWPMDPGERQKIIAALPQTWGQGLYTDLLAPSRSADPQFRTWWARLKRLGASPGATMALRQMNGQIDLRPVLPTIRVPTLVLHRLGDQDAGLDEVEEFLTGVLEGPEPDRVLATVLFTDIVSSTERAAELGDHGWRQLLEGYYGIVRRELARFRGREVDTARDGFLATFDGPAWAIRCACTTRDAVRALGIKLRTGVHTGECAIMGEKLVGIAVHIGARVAARAEPDEVLVSSTVKDLVSGSVLHFVDRGTHSLKGVPGEWRLFAAA